MLSSRALLIFVDERVFLQLHEMISPKEKLSYSCAQSMRVLSLVDKRKTILIYTFSRWIIAICQRKRESPRIQIFTILSLKRAIVQLQVYFLEQKWEPNDSISPPPLSIFRSSFWCWQLYKMLGIFQGLLQMLYWPIEQRLSRFLQKLKRKKNRTQITKHKKKTELVAHASLNYHSHIKIVKNKVTYESRTMALATIQTSWYLPSIQSNALNQGHSEKQKRNRRVKHDNLDNILLHGCIDIQNILEMFTE